MKSIKTTLFVCLTTLLLVAGCKYTKQSSTTEQQESAIQYTCPMHPQIIAAKPGSCPICGMTLVKRSGQATEDADISLNTVLQPVNATVLSSVSTINPQKKTVSTTALAEGYLDFDTRTFNNIASRFSGRIEKLYIKYAFQEIHAGQRIFDIYSPDMVSAQQDLVYLTKNSPNETGLVNAARQKLLLLGMTGAQVSQLQNSGKVFYSLPIYSPYEGHVHDVAHSQMPGTGNKPDQNYTGNLPLAVKEGMYVEKGQTLLNVVNPHYLWVILKLDNTNAASVKTGQPVTITLPDVPGKTVDGKVDFIEPVLQNNEKNTTLRVYIHNADHSLKVNALVKAAIQTAAVNGLWIPRSALTNLGTTQIVWLKSGAVLKAHVVKAGIINGTEVQVKSGLSVRDTIAENSKYLTDSESFIKTNGNEK